LLDTQVTCAVDITKRQRHAVLVSIVSWKSSAGEVTLCGFGIPVGTGKIYVCQ